jgi:hypothetical protein
MTIDTSSDAGLNHWTQTGKPESLPLCALARCDVTPGSCCDGETIPRSRFRDHVVQVPFQHVAKRDMRRTV